MLPHRGWSGSPPPTSWHSYARNRWMPTARIAAAALLLITLGAMLVWTPWRREACAPIALQQSAGGGDSALDLFAPLDADAPDPPELNPLSPLRHLILVAGHAVLTGDAPEGLDARTLSLPDNWALLDYQRSQLSAFLAHIRRGVELARADPLALLVFSGGETRRQAGPRSEAQSYWTAAQLSRWFAPDTEAGTQAPVAEGPNATSGGTAAAASASSSSLISSSGASASVPSTDPIASRALTEEFARDSLENLLFSLCRFREATGSYPTSITVVGFSFKEERFRTLHRGAMRFPAERFHYDGIDPPDSDTREAPPSAEVAAAAAAASAARRAALLESEQAKSFVPFLRDPYSCHAPLSTKKRTRNPFRRSHSGYERGCPELRHLLRHCSRDLFAGDLPWDRDGAELMKEQRAHQLRLESTSTAV